MLLYKFVKYGNIIFSTEEYLNLSTYLRILTILIEQ